MDRKERLRAELEENPWLEDDFEREQIEAKPSKLKEFGRKAMDSLGVKSAKSEKARDREAMAVVLREYRKEKEERRILAERREEERRAEEARLEQEKLREVEEREREALERDMNKARRHFEAHKQDFFEKQRVQEGLEEEFNGRLTTVGALEEAVMAEEEGVSKRMVEFEGEEIPVYDLTGKPFAMMSHAVDYRYANYSTGAADIGNKTAQDNLEHPELWGKMREEVEAEEGYGTRREDAKGDVISCSYVNSERNIASRVAKFGDYYTLCYGFERVPADSVLYVANGDGGTSNTGGKGETLISRGDLTAVERLEAAGGTSMYNEVVLRRYDEAGRALRPSYIIAEDGHITEAAMKHAEYFGVPIVNIVRRPYEARLEKKGEEALHSVSEESGYDEIERAVETFARAPRYYGVFRPIDSLGRARDLDTIEARSWQVPQIGVREEVLRLEKTELEKRIDLIEEALKGEVVEGKPKGFEYFSVLRQEAKGMYGAPGNCDEVTVTFRRKRMAKSIETRIYDGENVLEPEKAVASGFLKREDLERADSSYYRRIEPLLRGYEEKVRGRVVSA